MKKIHLFSTIISTIIFTSCFQNEEGLNGDLAGSNLLSDSVLVAEMDSIATLEQTDTTGIQKYVYLTIDDAPMRGSIYMDSVIQAKKVKTSVFFVGSMLGGSKTFKKNFEQLSRNPYVESYNHSFTHANHKYASYYKEPEKVLEDFNLNEAELQLKHQIARFPGRNTWQLGDRKKSESKQAAEAAQLLAENGYQVFGWDIEWKYEKEGKPKQTVDELVEEIEEAYQQNITFTKNHVIVLMHDQMFKTVYENRSLEELIDKLVEHNYTFRYIREYPVKNTIQ